MFLVQYAKRKSISNLDDVRTVSNPRSDSPFLQKLTINGDWQTFRGGNSVKASDMIDIACIKQNSGQIWTSKFY